MPNLRPLIIAVFLAGAARAADAEDGGWRSLLGGADLAGWTSAAGQQPGRGWFVEDGALVRKEPAGDLWTRDRFGDFVLDLEFWTTGNSGVFIRTDKPTDNVETGLEIQIERPVWWAPGKHSCGALYDGLAPTKEASKKDGWNHLVITARGPKITVLMNDEPIIDADLDRWTEAGKNPDGTTNKFHTALKDFKREGPIGLQHHGAVVQFRNIMIKLDSESGKRVATAEGRKKQPTAAGSDRIPNKCAPGCAAFSSLATLSGALAVDGANAVVSNGRSRTAKFRDGALVPAVGLSSANIRPGRFHRCLRERYSPLFRRLE